MDARAIRCTADCAPSCAVRQDARCMGDAKRLWNRCLEC